MDILIFLGKNSTNLQIAESLFIAENTVKVHVHNILEKLHLRNRREAGSLARFMGLVKYDPATNHLNGSYQGNERNK